MPLPTATSDQCCPFCDGPVEHIANDLYRCRACFEWLEEKALVLGGVIPDDDDDDEDYE